jgi:formate hydrogenlyase subunit 3/multisubunit Na+/H+ antiporter MnhD subunit
VTGNKKKVKIKVFWRIALCLIVATVLFSTNQALWGKTESGHEAPSHSTHEAPSEGSHSDGHEGAQGGEQGHADQGHDQVAGTITTEISAIAYLPLLIILIPAFASIALPLSGEDHKKRDIINVAATASVFLLMMSLYYPVVKGVHHHGHLYKGISYSLSFLPGFAFNLFVDPAAVVVGAVIAFLWLLSAVYGISYMTIEENRVRYDFFNMATLVANIGVILAGDFLTLFLFFEGLIIFPYALVAHKEDEKCLFGANLYLYVGCVSSLGLLFGIALLYKYTGTIMIRPVGDVVNASLTSSAKYWIAFLMVFGFGGKAGIFVEHIWLPEAHPVAPTPASALLSGAMIKAGAYGIFRTVDMLFVPSRWDVDKFLDQWHVLENIGYWVIWLGIITMFLAVLSALITANSKRMLAYHSVSQMGYIVMGIGCAAYMGSDGAMGLAGAMYHIVNHALFKASLFLCVGAIYFQTHELDMYKLGGMLKKMPVVGIGLFIAACGISGIPGFNGFASKTLLHHAIVEAYEHSVHHGGADFKLKLAEIIFMITAGGTFASNMKLFVLSCLRETPKKFDHAGPAPMPMRVAIGMVSFAILFIGLFPNWILEHFIGPALAYFHYNPASHAYHQLFNVHAAAGARHSVIPILYPVGNTVSHAWGAVLQNLNGGGVAVLLGGMYFIIGMPFGWFHYVVPKKAEFVYQYMIIFNRFKWFCTNPSSAFGDLVDRIVMKPMVDFWLPLASVRAFIKWFERKFIPRIVYEKELWQHQAARTYLKNAEVYKIADAEGIDAVVNSVADGALELGTIARKTQTGFIQVYATTIVVSIIVMIGLTLYFVG